MNNRIKYFIFIYLCFVFLTPVAAEKSSQTTVFKHQSFLKDLQQEDLVLLQGQGDLATRINSSKEDHIVLFMASWCDYCIEEINYFLEKVSSGNCSRLSIVSVDEKESNIRNYLKTVPNLKVPVYFDHKLKVKKSVKLDKLPYGIYIGRDKIYSKAFSGSTITRNQMNFIVADGKGRNGSCL